MSDPISRTVLDAATDITVAYLHSWPRDRTVEPKEITDLFLAVYKAVAKTDDDKSNWWQEFRQELGEQK